MKKVLFLILIPFIVNAQIFTAKNGKNISVNTIEIQYYIDNCQNIDAVNGKSILKIPYKIKLKNNIKLLADKNDIYQYEWVKFGKFQDVILYKTKVKYFTIDFDKKTYRFDTSWKNKTVDKLKAKKEIKKRDKNKKFKLTPIRG